MFLFYALQLIHFLTPTAHAVSGVGSPPMVTISPIGTPEGGISNFNATNGINAAYNSIFPAISMIVGIASVLYVIYAGAQYILSAGSPDKIKLARATLINAILGVIVVTAAYFVIKFAGSIGVYLSSLV